jgi:hypothetical protein
MTNNEKSPLFMIACRQEESEKSGNNIMSRVSNDVLISGIVA